MNQLERVRRGGLLGGPFPHADGVGGALGEGEEGQEGQLFPSGAVQHSLEHLQLVFAGKDSELRVDVEEEAGLAAEQGLDFAAGDEGVVTLDQFPGQGFEGGVDGRGSQGLETGAQEELGQSRPEQSAEGLTDPEKGRFGAAGFDPDLCGAALENLVRKQLP